MKKLALLLFVALATIACKKEPTTYSFTDIIGYSQSPGKVFGETLPEYEDPYVIIYEYSSEGIVAEVKIDPVPYNQKLIFTPNEKTEFLVVCYKSHGWWEYMQRDEPQTRYENRLYYLTQNENTSIVLNENTSISGKNPTK